MLRCLVVRYLLLILSSFLVPAALYAESSTAEPMVNVAEDLGVKRQGWPITFGFPAPRGLLTGAGDLYLEDPVSAQKLPVQVRELSRWPDGSMRWLLLDAQLDLAPHQKRSFRVRHEKPPEAKSALRIADNADAVEVDTGPLCFLVPKQRLALLDDIRLEGKPVGGGAVTSFLRVSDAPRPATKPPKSVQVVEQGPLRARVEIRGDYADGFQYIIRIDAFAGQPFVRVLHTFEYHGDQPYTAIRQLAIDIPLELGADASYKAGLVEAPPLQGAVAEAGAELVQIDNVTLRQGRESLARRGSGWVDLSDGNRGVVVAARYFWQEYPQAFSFRRSGLTYDMWSRRAQPAVVGMGAAKTHELIIGFHGASGFPAAEMNAFIVPLIAKLDPQWVRDSDALPQAIAPANGTRGFLQSLTKSHDRYRVTNDKEEWDDSVHVTCAAGARQVRRHGAYGMWNWGDWNFPGYHDSVKGCDAWGNHEYDTTQVLALGFAATEDRAFYDGMVAAARHFMDVDSIHYQRAHPDFVGMNHPKNPLHFTFEMGGVDLGHTWNEGLLSYYYLTGDERGREAALGIADYLERRIRKGKVRGNPRQWGWPQVALTAAYEATLDERYRRAADAYARGGMQAHPPAANHWKFGILADTLAYTHASTTDAALRTEIEQWLTSYSRAALEAGVKDPRFFPAIAYAGRLGGDQKAVDTARAVAERLQLGSWGKPFTLGGRIGFRILNLTERRPPAPASARAEAAAPRPTQTARAKARPK